MLEERARLLDGQVPEGEAYVDFDPKRPEAHEIVNNPPRHRSAVEQTRLREHLLVVKGDALVGARVVEMPPCRARVAPGQGQLLVVRPLVDDPGPGVGRIGAVEVRELRRRDRYITDPILVQAVRAGEVVGNAQPSERLEVGRPGSIQVMAQRPGLAEQVMCFVETTHFFFCDSLRSGLVRGAGRQRRPCCVGHPVPLEQLEAHGPVPFLAAGGKELGRSEREQGHLVQVAGEERLAHPSQRTGPSPCVR